MALLYPGYKSYFNRFRTKPFHTEYTTRYCSSETPVLYNQVPKYTWNEPRRPAIATRHKLDGTTAKLTHLRPPFAARMTSYEPEGKYLGVKTARGEATLLGRSGSSERKVSCSVKPDVSTKPNTPPPTERGSSREEFAEDHELQMLKISSTQTARNATTSAKQVQLERSFRSLCTSSPLEPSPSLPGIASSFSVARARKFGKAPPTLTRDQHLDEAMTSSPSTRDGCILGRVAPRPSTLLSKHPKDVRYVRDTCFFQPTQERKRHYYIVNPNWFSEQRVIIPKNNVFL